MTASKRRCVNQPYKQFLFCRLLADGFMEIPLFRRLYRGDQLEEALAWKERTLPSQDENAFLQASVTAQERQRAAALELQHQEKQYKRRAVLVGLGVGFVVKALLL